MTIEQSNRIKIRGYTRRGYEVWRASVTHPCWWHALLFYLWNRHWLRYWIDGKRCG